MAYTLGEIPVTQTTTNQSWFRDFTGGLKDLAPTITGTIQALRRDKTPNVTVQTGGGAAGGAWYQNPVVLVAGVGLLAVVLLSKRK